MSSPDVYQGAPQKAELIRSVEATTDQGVMDAYLREVEASRSPNTLRLYTREITRFVQFFNGKGIGLADLRREHMTGYMAMLQQQVPPLKQKSLETIAGTISGFMSYLAKVGHIRINPGAALTFRKVIDQDDHEDKFFNPRQWEALEAVCAGIGCPVKRSRMRFMLIAGMRLCLRIGDLAAMQDDHFILQKDAWWLHVLGKGNSHVVLPVTPDVMEALNEYRRTRSLAPLRTPGAPLATLQSLYHQKPLGVTGISRELRALYKATAESLRSYGATEDADWVARATPHWLRHTGVTMLINSGVQPSMVQKMARHKRYRTTERYIHTDREQWHAAILQAASRPDKSQIASDAGTQSPQPDIE